MWVGSTFQYARSDRGEEIGSRGRQVRGGSAVGRQSRPGQMQRAGRQQERIERVRKTGRLAELHERAAWLEHRNGVEKRVLANGIEHRLDPGTIAQRQGAFDEVLRPIVDDMIASRKTCDRRLAGIGNRADDSEPQRLGPLHEDLSDASGRRVI